MIRAVWRRCRTTIRVMQGIDLHHHSNRGRPPLGSRFPPPMPLKSLTMPTDEMVGLNNDQNGSSSGSDVGQVATGFQQAPALRVVVYFRWAR